MKNKFCMATQKKQISAKQHEFTFSFASFISSLTIARQPYIQMSKKLL
jgi:hypothetical protein